RGGFVLAERLLAFPRPVVVACTGHAVAMGLFLVLSADYRIGAAGADPPPPHHGARRRPPPPAPPRHTPPPAPPPRPPPPPPRARALADIHPPADAVAAGILDRVVPTAELADAARSAAARLAQLDPGAHAATKLRTRDATLQALRAALEGDDDLELRPNG